MEFATIDASPTMWLLPLPRGGVWSRRAELRIGGKLGRCSNKRGQNLHFLGKGKPGRLGPAKASPLPPSLPPLPSSKGESAQKLGHLEGV